MRTDGQHKYSLSLFKSRIILRVNIADTERACARYLEHAQDKEQNFNAFQGHRLTELRRMPNNSHQPQQYSRGGQGCLEAADCRRSLEYLDSRGIIALHR
jgi:hypothetical protein